MHTLHYDPVLDQTMHTSPSRATQAVIFALAMLSLAPPSWAQQAAAPQQAPALSQAAAVPAQAVRGTEAPEASAVAPSVPEPPASEGAVTTPGDGGSRPLKSTTAGLRE